MESTGDPAIVQSMLQCCSSGDRTSVIQMIHNHGHWYGCYQDETSGQSPLMVAAYHGHMPIVRYLLEECKAPWNAVDRNGQCAGNMATDQHHWEIVEYLVDWGTRAELILGRIERQQHPSTTTTTVDGPVEHQPSTKPEYLRQQLHYKKDVLLDSDQDAVMMEWERPLMKAHAQILMQEQHCRRVLNVGFGMGIIDSILQEYHPAHHIIIEAHPDVYQRMKETGWLSKPNVRVCFGKWQDVLPQLIREGVMLDAIFYDTYGEHFMDMEDFHALMTQILAKPHGVYSFFNGLAPDNLFFHGVACQCVKLQLASLGLDSEFATCEIQVKESVWNNVRRKYWHGRDTYYLPIVKWNPQYLSTGQVPDSPLLKRKGDEAEIETDEVKKRPATS